MHISTRSYHPKCAGAQDVVFAPFILGDGQIFWLDAPFQDLERVVLHSHAMNRVTGPALQYLCMSMHD